MGPGIAVWPGALASEPAQASPGFLVKCQAEDQVGEAVRSQGTVSTAEGPDGGPGRRNG